MITEYISIIIGLFDIDLKVEYDFISGDGGSNWEAPTGNEIDKMTVTFRYTLNVCPDIFVKEHYEQIVEQLSYKKEQAYQC